MGTSSANSLDQTLAGQIFSSKEIRANLEILCDDFGSRFAGTESEKKAALFLHDKLRAYGLEDVRSEAFEYCGWTRGTARLKVTSPWQRELSCLSMPMSPPGRAAGKIVDLGNGAPETFAAMDGELRGNIALVSIANPVEAARWIQRTEKYNRTMLAGASAFIFMGDEAGYGPVTGALGFNQWGLIPGIMISKETGLLLRRLIQRHGMAAVEIETTDTTCRKTSWNIIGDVKGSADSAETVVIGAHYDGHDIAQGAHDPASGLVAALAAAQALAQGTERPKHNLRFILFGVEELGLIGAHAYVDGHCEQLDFTRFMLNMDAAGGPGSKILSLYGHDTRTYFRTMAADIDEEFTVDMDRSPLREPDHLSADHYPFMAQGLPCAFIRQLELSVASGFYHTAHDTVDKVRAIDIKEAAYLCARLVWRVADDGNWPFKRTSQEEQTRAQTEYDKSEVRAIEKAVEQLRQQVKKGAKKSAEV